MESVLLTASSPRALHPVLTTDKVTLKPHQLAMIQRCGEIEETSDVLVMNDKPGSGKTYAILGYLLARKQALGGKIETTIIFVPHHILTHVARALKSAHASVPRVVLDEALALHVMYASVPAEKTWFVSGDCDLVEHFPTMPKNWRGHRFKVACQCDDRFVASSFDLEEPLVTEKHCTSLLLERVLIPARVTDEKELIIALLRYTQQSREANSDRIELCKSALERHTMKGIGNERTQREVYENEIRECVNKMGAAESLIRTIMERVAECGLCVACFDGPISRRLVAPCDHAFCEACGAKPPSECPVCGARISGSLQTAELEAPQKEGEEGPNKLECLLEIVEKSGPAAKILLFSKHVRIYQDPGRFRSRGVPYADLEGGSQAVIDGVVRDFKRGRVKLQLSEPVAFWDEDVSVLDVRFVNASSACSFLGLGLEGDYDISISFHPRSAKPIRVLLMEESGADATDDDPDVLERSKMWESSGYKVLREWTPRSRVSSRRTSFDGRPPPKAQKDNFKGRSVVYTIRTLSARMQGKSNKGADSDLDLRLGIREPMPEADDSSLVLKVTTITRVLPRQEKGCTSVRAVSSVRITTSAGARSLVDCDTGSHQVGIFERFGNAVYCNWIFGGHTFECGRTAVVPLTSPAESEFCANSF
ncbi:hypothetical protein KFL_002190020 [Klebsormidium nitens]|uniref:RING-type domain-containing protein n=1 Tax=Klebsormidium nitens TaxID=105231 RepID=A0A1Y1IAC1_KLENI|nr:hypothetical protein KFL_002190020 [Klebsormidium nitens]|eukprot:GAQ85048.1 hypothetical protein KFL_002190020 [Klebsormidium nitens]